MNLSEVQIDGNQIRKNVESLRRLLSTETAVIAVVKGNAYGHGLAEVVLAIDSVVEGFQVDDIEELRELRRLTDKRALVLGYVGTDDVEEAIRLDGELAIYDIERLPIIAEAGRNSGKQPKVHLKIDALLGRQGILPAEVDRFTNSLRAYSDIQLLTAYAHFANIEDTTDLVHAFEQQEVFYRVWNQLREFDWPELGRHLSATSGLMTVEKGNDLVRLGLGLYGMYPSASLARRHSDLELKPALRWVSHLSQVKVLPAHHPVGYGLTYITHRETRIGIVPQGYADGYDRGLSNSGEVLVHGKRCSVLGRVAMNMFAIDLSSVPGAKAEDEVVLLGDQADDRISAEDLAFRLGTINYEVTTRIAASVPRRLI